MGESRQKKENRTGIGPQSTWKEITPGGTVYHPGSAGDFNTGDWRSVRPVWNEAVCKQCLLCVPVCPDTAVPVEEGKRLDFDYFHCKGCMVCLESCTFGAISEETERA